MTVYVTPLLHVRSSISAEPPPTGDRDRGEHGGGHCTSDDRVDDPCADGCLEKRTAAAGHEKKRHRSHHHEREHEVAADEEHEPEHESTDDSDEREPHRYPEHEDERDADTESCSDEPLGHPECPEVQVGVFLQDADHGKEHPSDVMKTERRTRENGEDDGDGQTREDADRIGSPAVRPPVVMRELRIVYSHATQREWRDDHDVPGDNAQRHN